MSPEELWAKARAAAEQLQGVEHARVFLGACLTKETIQELARLARVEVKHCAYQGGPTLERMRHYVIYSISANVGGVCIEAQGIREPQPGDEDLPGHISSGLGHSIPKADFLKGGGA